VRPLPSALPQNAPPFSTLMSVANSVASTPCQIRQPPCYRRAQTWQPWFHCATSAGNPHASGLSFGAVVAIGCGSARALRGHKLDTKAGYEHAATVLHASPYEAPPELAWAGCPARQLHSTVITAALHTHGRRPKGARVRLRPRAARASGHSSPH
jgi:hypothetical protein